MAGLINYELQQSPETARRTEDTIDRYEWAQGIQQIERTAEGALQAYGAYQQRLKEDAAKQQKLQENIDESNYEREMRQLSIELSTIDVASSERIRRIQEIDDGFMHLDPSKKAAIRKNVGFGDEYNISYSLSTQRAQEYVAKQKELDNSYMNLARAFKGAAVDSMTPEEQIELGKQIENERILNNSNIQYMTSGNTDGSLVPSVQTTSAISLQKAITEDANRWVSSGGSLDFEWVNNEAAVMLNQLQNSGYTPEQASALTDQAMRYYRQNADYLAKNQDEAAKVKANSKKMMADQYAVNLQDLTGMPLDVNLTLLNNLQYITDLEAKQKVLGTIDQLYAARLNNYTANSYLTPSTLYTASALNSVARPGASIQASAASLMYAIEHSGEFTRGQLTNQGLVLNEVLNANYEDPMQKLQMTEENLNAYLNASTNNAVKWAELTQDILPAVTDQFKKAPPEKQKEMKDSYNKTIYNFLDDTLEKVARETRGAITYSDGVLTSDYRLDRQTLNEANNIISEMRNIAYNSQGATDSWKEMNDTIKRLVVDKSLGFENKSNIGSDIVAGINWVSSGLGSVMNTEQGRALVMTPREAMRTSANMRKMGVNSGIVNFVEGVLSVGGLREDLGNILINPAQVPQSINKTTQAVREVGGRAFGEAVQAIENRQNRMSNNLEDFIKGYEGFKGEVYDDNGEPAIGYGFHLSTLQNVPEATKAKLEKVAPGSTLEGFDKISKDQAGEVLHILVEDVYQPEAKRFVGANWNNLPKAVQDVVADMNFNMGYETLSQFSDFRDALQKGDLATAAREIEDSNYFRSKKTKERATANINKILRSF